MQNDNFVKKKFEEKLNAQGNKSKKHKTQKNENIQGIVKMTDQ